MTIVIDKTNPNTDIIVSKSGATMTLVNRSTNVTSVINLTGNTSPYPERYYLFQVNTEVFSGLTDDVYTYTIGSATGICKVVSGVFTPEEEVENNYIFLDSDLDNGDEYIVYNS